MGTPAAGGEERAGDSDDAYSDCAAESTGGEELLDAALSLYVRARFLLLVWESRNWLDGWLVGRSGCLSVPVLMLFWMDIGHWYQDEYFHIREGCVLIFSLSLSADFPSSLPSLRTTQKQYHGLPNARFRRYIFTLEGKDTIVSAADPQPVRIPARARHTFKVDDTHEGPCTIEISTDVSPASSADEPEANGASPKL